MIRVLVCGGRAYADRARLFRELDLLEIDRGISLVIHGGAPGADDLAEAWAISRAVPHRWYPAEWARHGRAAGPIRNQQMIDEGKPDLVLAFPGGAGTADLVARAVVAGIEVRKIEEEDE